MCKVTPALQRCRRNNIERRRNPGCSRAPRAEVRAEAGQRGGRARSRVAIGRSARAAAAGESATRAARLRRPAPHRGRARPTGPARRRRRRAGARVGRRARGSTMPSPSSGARTRCERYGRARCPRGRCRRARWGRRPKAAATLLRDWRGPLRTLVALDAAAPLGRARSLPRPHARSPPASVGAERAAGASDEAQLQTMRRCGGGANVGRVNPTYLSCVPSILELEPDARFVVPRQARTCVVVLD